MFNRFLSILCSALAVILLSVVSAHTYSVNVEASNNAAAKSVSVVSAAETENFVPDSAKVLEARFLNMLNHNYAYDGDFDTVEALVNQSVIALSDMRDSEDEAFISQDIVAEYIFDMYGIEITDFSDINTAFPQKDGFVYIVPRGYSQLTHRAVSITGNEDGSYTFMTEVVIDAHDGEACTDVCETLFVKNEASAFGFSIISSVIGTEAVAL